MKPRYIILFILILLTGCSEKTAKLSTLSPDAVILAFGDSLTFGTGTTKDKSYPAQLAKKINRIVINAGKPGEVSSKGLLRLPALLAQHQPELVIICHGGNDFLRKKNTEKLTANLSGMIQLARNHGAQVILIGVPKPRLLLSSDTLYEELSESFSLPYQGKILPEVLSNPQLKSDTIHPNEKGYQQIADAIYQLMQKTGALP